MQTIQAFQSVFSLFNANAPIFVACTHKDTKLKHSL
jgi:hypothetical protein